MRYYNIKTYNYKCVFNELCLVLVGWIVYIVYRTCPRIYYVEKD